MYIETHTQTNTHTHTHTHTHTPQDAGVVAEGSVKDDVSIV